MKPTFFERKGWLIYPCTITGIIFSWAVAAVDGFMFRYVDNTSHSVSDTVDKWGIWSLIFLAIWYVVAFAFSTKRQSA